MSDEENSGVFSRRKDYERRVPVTILPLPFIFRLPPSSKCNSAWTSWINAFTRGEPLIGLSK